MAATAHTSSSYRTALVASAFRGDCEGMRALLAMVLPSDVVTPATRHTFANVSLLKAAHGGYPDAVRILLSAGAQVSNANGQGNTALHLAAEQGHLRVSSAHLSLRHHGTTRVARAPPPQHIK